jgi:hypothetical protein
LTTSNCTLRSSASAGSPRVGPVHVRQLHTLTGRLPIAPASSSTCARSCSVAGVTRRAKRCQGIHGGVDLRAFLALRAIVAAPVPALGRRAQRATVQSGPRGTGREAPGKAQERPKIVKHRFEDPGEEPPLGLLVDGLPWGKVVGQHPPRRTGPHDPLQRVEDLAQVVGTLGDILADERQVGGDEGPLLVGDVGRVGLSVLRHALMLAPRPHKSMTRSSASALDQGFVR